MIVDLYTMKEVCTADGYIYEVRDTAGRIRESFIGVNTYKKARRYLRERNKRILGDHDVWAIGY